MKSEGRWALARIRLSQRCHALRQEARHLHGTPGTARAARDRRVIFFGEDIAVAGETELDALRRRFGNVVTVLFDDPALAVGPDPAPGAAPSLVAPKLVRCAVGGDFAHVWNHSGVATNTGKTNTGKSNRGARLSVTGGLP